MYSAHALMTKKPTVRRVDDNHEKLELYKQKLDVARRQYDDLIDRFQTLSSTTRERLVIEADARNSELKNRKLSDALSRTQALLVVQRQISQQMALRADLLQQQHEADKEKLDLLLSLDGRTAPRRCDTVDRAMQQHVERLEQQLKQQAALLMEERSVMKLEWDRERQVHERASKQLREQVRQLQDDLIASNRSLALLNRRGLDDVDGSSDVDDVGDVISAAAASLGDGAARAPPPAGHCGVQQSKQLARQVVELQRQLDVQQRKALGQTAHISQLTEQLRKTQHKLQVQSKNATEQVARLKQSQADLDKRRQLEGSGFRSEIQLLKAQLERTQRQLCYLTLRAADQ